MVGEEQQAVQGHMHLNKQIHLLRPILSCFAHCDVQSLALAVGTSGYEGRMHHMPAVLALKLYANLARLVLLSAVAHQKLVERARSCMGTCRMCMKPGMI